MRKITKIINITLIFILIGLFSYQDISYAFNLRVPMVGVDRKKAALGRLSSKSIAVNIEKVSMDGISLFMKQHKGDSLVEHRILPNSYKWSKKWLSTAVTSCFICILVNVKQQKQPEDCLGHYAYIISGSGDMSKREGIERKINDKFFEFLEETRNRKEFASYSHRLYLFGGGFYTENKNDLSGQEARDKAKARIINEFRSIGVNDCVDLTCDLPNLEIAEVIDDIKNRKIMYAYKYKLEEEKKNWEALQHDYEMLITAAFSEEELKRVFRKMASEVHPDHNRGDEKNAEDVFKHLADIIGKKLKKDFKIMPEDFGADMKDSRWMDLWASVTPQYQKDNSVIMEESVSRLKERALRLSDAMSENDLIVKFLAERSVHLSMNEIDRLLDITSKKSFASELLAITQATTVSVGTIPDEDIWKIRPLLERLYLANQLRTGEIVFIRIGNRIERTVILEELTGQNPKLKAITIGAPFKGPIDYDLGGENSRFIELTNQEIVADLVDFEREPKQIGYPINIGDIVEIDNGSDALFIATVYGVHHHYYHAILHRPIGRMDYRLKYGYYFGTDAGERALKGELGNQRIKKIEIPVISVKPRLNSFRLPQKELRTGS
ncbi:MAG: hypothetical protein KKF54_02615 [Candidatus Omnitrophica bacterium]|nr:hypothetical protein [Candidatus Omnitrophota bacterium]